MDLTQEFINIIELISEKCDIPPIEDIYIPNKKDLTNNQKKANFGAIKLKGGYTGIFFIGLKNEFHEIRIRKDLKALIKKDPIEIALNINSKNLFDRTISLGTINAISHYLFMRSNFQFTPSKHIVNDINIQNHDIIGMVGYFPPLVKKITAMGNKLIIVELKEELTYKSRNWEITMDTSKLTVCNKVICTSTTLINNTLDNVLEFTQNAETFALIGPTAGFLPDPIFQRKVNIVGGSVIHNSDLFFNRIIQGERWGESVLKYVISKETYPGIKKLIENANK